MKVKNLFYWTGQLPERIKTMSLNPRDAQASHNLIGGEPPSIDLANLVLPNPDSSILVELKDGNDDFKAGDFLVVDLVLAPKPGDYLLYEDSPSVYAVRKYVQGLSVDLKSSLVSDYSDNLHNSRGTVTRVLSILR